SPALSADGSVAAFESTADNLPAGDGNHVQDVFVRNLAAGTTALASLRAPVLPTQVLSNWGGGLAAVTPDDRYVAFGAAGAVSNYHATNLVTGVSVDAFSGHVFVRDQ